MGWPWVLAKPAPHIRLNGCDYGIDQEREAWLRCGSAGSDMLAQNTQSSVSDVCDIELLL